jgi:hypothetical protein
MTTKEEPKMITVKELAARHKMEPRRLRVILRSTGMRAKDGRYEWKEGDVFLKKLPDIIKQYDAGEEEKKKASKK